MKYKLEQIERPLENDLTLLKDDFVNAMDKFYPRDLYKESALNIIDSLFNEYLDNLKNGKALPVWNSAEFANIFLTKFFEKNSFASLASSIYAVFSSDTAEDKAKRMINRFLLTDSGVALVARYKVLQSNSLVLGKRGNIFLCYVFF